MSMTMDGPSVGAWDEGLVAPLVSRGEGRSGGWGVGLWDGRGVGSGDGSSEGACVAEDDLAVGNEMGGGGSSNPPQSSR